VVAAGSVRLNGETLNPRDGAAIHDAAALEFDAVSDAELVLVDTV
jgi:quercetin 2,3-dioxygenase